MIDVTCPFRRSIDRIAALAIVGAVGLGPAVIPGEASAQLKSGSGSSNVMADESVTGGATGELLPPLRTTPRSRLLAPRPPTGAPVVEQPHSKVTLTPPPQRQARRTPPAAPATSEAAKAPPTPLAKPEPSPAPPPASKMAKPAPAPKPRAPAAAPKPPAPKMAKPAPAPIPRAPAAAPKPLPAPTMAKPAPAPKPRAPAAAPKPPSRVAAAPPAPKIEKAAPAPQQQAARTPGPDAAPLQSVVFAFGNADLPEDSGKVLDSLATSLTVDSNLRMQLLAYAGEPNLSASQARRLSLSRALAVRSYLIGKGIRSTRIDVRALGNKVPSGTPNRVDLRIIAR